jgi:hypothetical protein
MRVRALLLVLLAGGIAAGGSTLVGAETLAARELRSSPTVLGRADPVDAPTPSVAVRVRDAAGRELGASHDALPWLVLCGTLALGAAWLLAHERRVRSFGANGVAVLRPRAPPVWVATVHS